MYYNILNDAEKYIHLATQYKTVQPFVAVQELACVHKSGIFGNKNQW